MGFHDITVEPVAGTVRVVLDGKIVAESADAVVLREGRLPPRYYLPRADVRAELAPSARRSHCPFKGDAGYHSVGAHADVAWFYAEPKERVTAIRDRIAFYNDRVELLVDGE